MKNEENAEQSNEIWTEIVAILDRSGSMSNIVDDTIGGFNGFIERQAAEEGRARVTLVLFSVDVATPHENVDVEAFPKLDRNVYQVGGSTALLDAMGRTLEKTRFEIEAMHPDERPDNVVVLVMTDGYENASQEYDARTVRAMVEMRQADGWEFVFIGADINAHQVADQMGMHTGSASVTAKTIEGVDEAYRRMSRAVSNLRRGESKGDVDAPLEERDPHKGIDGRYS